MRIARALMVACSLSAICLAGGAFALAEETEQTQADDEKPKADEKPSETDPERPKGVVETVTVTATRVETDLMKTPVAVTVLDQENMNREGVVDVRDIAQMVPNMDIATINGQATGADGLNIVYSANGLSLGFTLDEDFGSGNTGATNSTIFTVKASGGATFQLGTTTSTRATIGIDSLAPYNLGGGNGSARLSELKAGGAQALKTDAGGALTSVREAISEVASIRGRLGGFQKFQVGSAISALQAAQTGLTEATSAIGDTDFALATARLNQETVLIQSSIQLLGVAGQQAAMILSLL